MQQNIQTWVDALRSGEYQQCQETLHNGKGYCCLGVYAKVNNLATDEFMVSSDCVEGPQSVYEDIRQVLDNDLVDDLIQMNDGGDSFKDIADYIEERYKDK